MELLEVLITLPLLQTVTVPAGATTGTVVYQQLLILLQNPDLYYCLWNCFGYWNNDNDAAPTVATITPASATEGSRCV
jgi:hypothetical protein